MGRLTIEGHKPKSVKNVTLDLKNDAKISVLNVQLVEGTDAWDKTYKIVQLEDWSSVPEIMFKLSMKESKMLRDALDEVRGRKNEKNKN